MSTTPATKKRALTPWSATADVTSCAVATSHVQSPVTASPFLNTSIGSSILKAELEHERSLRVLDAKRARHKLERLENMIKFKDEELDGCKKMLEEEQLQGEVHLEQIRKSRDEAIKQLRDLQRSSFSQMDGSSDGRNNESLWQRKHGLVKSQNETKDQENKQLRMQIRELQAKLEESMKENKALEPSTPTGIASVQGQSSPAPSDLMHELNRVRIDLAETERKQRQLRRTAEEWQKKAKTLLPEKEAARSNLIRVQKLEAQLKEEMQKLQMAQMRNEEWQAFGKALLVLFPEAQTSEDAPPPQTPSAVAIIRHVQEIKQKLLEAQEVNQALEQRAVKLRDMQQPTEARMKSMDQKEATWREEHKAMENQLNSKQQQIETLQHQEDIWKREINSLQQMVKTFDKLPLARSTCAGPSLDAALQTVELGLKSTKEELHIVKVDRMKIQQEKKEQQQELERVKEKYRKLHEALGVQKRKTQEAEAKAIRAEELAGKGSFNRRETKVLHLTQNPRTDSLEDQVCKLKKQLELLQGRVGGGQKAAASSASSVAEVNPDKLHQRLKESFKEQIGVFREGVYLMTGYKIDMITGMGSQKPTFRVRSMYSEKEEDHLLLKWPKRPEGESPSSLDMMGTDWASALSHTPSSEYMKRYSSLPAFLASVQLSLFENQTMM